MWRGDGVVGETGAMTRRQLLRARSEGNVRRCCQSDIGSTEFMNDEGPITRLYDRFASGGVSG